MENLKESCNYKIEHLLNKYYINNVNNKDCIMVLPLKENPKYCKKTKTGGLPFFGTKNNLDAKNFYELEENNVTQVYNKTKGIYEDFKLSVDIETADAYEIRNRLSNYNILIVDIDGINANGDCTLNEFLNNENTPDFFKNNKIPYTLSRGKGLPHYHFIVEGLDNIKYLDNTYQECFNTIKADLLFNHVWEMKYAILYDYNGELPKFQWNNIKDMLNKNVLNTINNTTNNNFEDNISLFSDNDSYFDNRSIITNATTMNEYTYKSNLEKFMRASQCFTDEWMDNQGNWYKFTSHFKKIFPNNIKEWDEICRRFPNKYNEKRNKETWDNDNPPSTLFFPALLKFCKESNKEMYYNIFKNDYIVDLYSPMCTSSLFAEYFESSFGDLFIFNNGSLYYFNGVYWKEDDKNKTYLHLFVNTEFYNLLIKYVSVNLNRVSNDITKTDNEKEDINKKIQLLLKNINYIKENKRRKAIIDDIIIYVTNNEIVFNENPFLFAFENKIFNLNEKKWIKPNPSDYISLTVGYKYIDENNNEKKKFLNELIDKIFPNPEIKKFYLKILSCGLCGLQVQKFFIATGAGGNGKSVLNSLMLKTIGNYGYVLPSAFLLNKIKLDNNPQAYAMHGKRFCISQEPDRKCNICCSTVKELTGNDGLNVRDNHSKASDCGITLNMTLLMECNDIPLLDETTEAMIRRVIAIPFVSRFVSADDYEPNNENIYKGNPYLSTPSFRNEYKQALFDILIDYFELFKNDNYDIINIPLECNEVTSSYMEDSDNLFRWFEDNYEKTRDTENNILNFKDILNNYKSSDDYINLTKENKRKINLKNFSQKLEQNVFLKKYIKRRDEYHNGDKLNTNCIVSWGEKIKQ